MNDELDKALEWADIKRVAVENMHDDVQRAHIYHQYPAYKHAPILAAAVRELRETVKAKDEEIARLMPLVIKTKRFERGDCPICHYNGPGYFQPDKHPCAKYYHEAEINPSLDEALNSGDGSYKP